MDWWRGCRIGLTAHFMRRCDVGCTNWTGVFVRLARWWKWIGNEIYREASSGQSVLCVCPVPAAREFTDAPCSRFAGIARCAVFLLRRNCPMRCAYRAYRYLWGWEGNPAVTPPFPVGRISRLRRIRQLPPQAARTRRGIRATRERRPPWVTPGGRCHQENLPDALCSRCAGIARCAALIGPTGTRGVGRKIQPLHPPSPVGRISRPAAHPANAAKGGTNGAPPPPISLVTPLPRDAPPGALPRPRRPGRGGCHTWRDAGASPATGVTPGNRRHQETPFPAPRELPDALRLSGLQVSEGGREIRPPHPPSPADATTAPSYPRPIRAIMAP